MPARQAAALPVKKTKHQEEQEDLNRPAWVLSGAPWVTIAFAIVQIQELISLSKKGGPPPETQPLQVNDITEVHDTCTDFVCTDQNSNFN